MLARGRGRPCLQLSESSVCQSGSALAQVQRTLTRDHSLAHQEEVEQYATAAAAVDSTGLVASVSALEHAAWVST